MKEKKTIRSEIQKYFSMRGFLTDKSDVVTRINDGISFRGPNLWVLVFAILIASLGLNMNSTAVIIGAMLISPLMGPIIGMGFAVGTNDFELLKKSLNNYLVATVISLITAAIYFFLTPYHGAQSELLARTSPTLYDVLIALFGGAAGIVALGAKDRGNIIPGVAIATALMPPLCTAGFGIASLNIKYFLGAFYLYFINTVFIALATYLGVRMMSFRYKVKLEDKAYRRVRNYLLGIVVATMLPASIMTVSIVRDSFFQSGVQNFVKSEMNFNGTQIISQSIDKKNKVVVLAAVGKEITEEQLNAASEKMPRYGMKDYTLSLIQGNMSDSLMSLRGSLSNISATREELNSTIGLQNKEILELRKSLEEYRKTETLTKQAITEIQPLYPQIESISISRAIESGADTNDIKSGLNIIVYISAENSISLDDKQKISEWLRRRTGSDYINLIITQN